MDNNDLLINSQFATLSTKIDALVSILSDEQREQFLNEMTQRMSKIYEVFKSKMTEEQFNNFRKLCEDGLYRH